MFVPGGTMKHSSSRASRPNAVLARVSSAALSLALGAATQACVSKDCPVTSQHVQGRCLLPDAGSHGGADAGAKAKAKVKTSNTHEDAGGNAPDSSNARMPDAAVAADGGREVDAGVRNDAGMRDDASARDAGVCDGAESVICFEDADKDGYAADGAKSSVQCASACSEGWTATEPSPGESDCDDHRAASHPAAMETCNATDDDCDAHTDEDTDNLCALGNATAVCKSGTCQVESCDPGYDDCDAVQSNGCEQSLTLHDSCGVCGTVCDPRAECVASPSTHDVQVCECRAPLSGDGASCFGAGPLTLGFSNGVGYVCGLRPDGSVECFGGSAPSHSSSNTFSQLGAGRQHICGIRKDDAHLIECWGDDNTHGQIGSGNFVSNGAEFVQVVSGEYHSCGLDAAGTATCWGAMDPSGSTTTIAYGQAAVPADAQGHFRQLSAGAYHTCGLKHDGLAVCWGAGKRARSCALGDIRCTPDQLGQSVAPTSEHFIQIASGVLHTCGLRADGSVLCWGLGVMKQGSGFDFGQAAPQAGPFLQISAGFYQSCGVTHQHKVECWGSGPTLSGSGSVLRVYAGQLMTCELYTSAAAQCFTTPASSASILDNLPWALNL
jgi:hypothetical protein